MPLRSIGEPATIIDEEQRLVGMKMRVQGTDSHEFVWVAPTQKCLQELAPSELIDAYSAPSVAEAHRDRIERSASAKFEAEGIDERDGVYEGIPIVRLLYGDILEA
jgi:hypothetical protein